MAMISCASAFLTRKSYEKRTKQKKRTDFSNNVDLCSFLAQRFPYLFAAKKKRETSIEIQDVTKNNWEKTFLLGSLNDVRLDARHLVARFSHKTTIDDALLSKPATT